LGENSCAPKDRIDADVSVKERGQNMLEDDHYIANSKNAHIDTSVFEAAVRERLSGTKCEEEAVLEFVYDLVFSRTNIAPKEPLDDQLICRYLSPEKFLQFLHTRQIYLPMATQFSDPRECCVPEDYEAAVLRVLCSLQLSANTWSRLVRRKAETWNVSCWTQLDDHFDDHLLWSAYAGGSQGVGITVRYGVLRNSFARSLGQLAVNGVLHRGNVNYETLSVLPFNKHYMFRNEKEVRFAFRASRPGVQRILIEYIFGRFGVRISPAATSEHRDMIRRLWLNYGGEDRVQWPQ
jgi:hypothetical protein